MKEFYIPKGRLRKFCYMDLRKVVLYYPNRWRRNVKGEVPDEDLKFNWFLCSKRYRDAEGNDVIDVSSKQKFYDETTGDTLVVATKPCILLIVNDGGGNTPAGEVVKKIKKGGYQGMVSTMGCVSTSCCEDFICREVNFFFKRGVLATPRKKECEILEYAKRNYETVSKYISDFPTPEEIDDVLKEYPCSTTCKVLYRYITDYFRLAGKE